MTDTAIDTQTTPTDALADALATPELQTVHAYNVGSTAVRSQVEVPPITADMVTRLAQVNADRSAN